ncbi:Transcriptional regulator, BadM/Rrf2 family [Candidatus Zixiibacteriota bacterium]|nr:Transcriptional regulator, BadM/Rrf2 family [candidate division Zixibacteria bacterium]
MKVTALEEYGLRCMILLARSGTGESLTLPEISAKEGLSLPYAGKLLMILKQSGLVKAVRGRRGGYTLAKPAEEIVLREVFDALGEPVFGPNHCERYNEDGECCVHNDDCTVRTVWGTFNRFVSGYLDSVTLADLVKGNGNATKGELPTQMDQSN